MKKIVLLFMALVGVLDMHAEDYAYLTFVTTDGVIASVPTSSLSITINGTTLTVGSETFVLSNLSKMYFSTSDESTAGIEEITNGGFDEASEIYDMQGHKVSKEQMRKGVYIVKTKNKTFKIVVK